MARVFQRVLATLSMSPGGRTPKGPSGRAVRWDRVAASGQVMPPSEDLGSSKGDHGLPNTRGSQAFYVNAT